MAVRAGAAKVRKIDPDGKMNQIVRVARSLFVEKGYHNVSIPQIVKASGVSTGTIYNHFTNKEGLAAYIHTETLNSFQQRFSARLQNLTSTYDQLRCFAELVIEITEEEPELMEYMLFMKHGEFLSESFPICSTEPFRKVQQIVAEGIKNGELRDGDYLVSAVSYTGVIIRAAELRIQGVINVSLSDRAEELISNAWAAIKA
ncbi:transcriptional regulator, TetR family [Malonomonas rubra DSM 5091]|uniref:Transcriptional regulator, TetR family n=1 Tax=Malonomonas rubra DSM 5091 TaxID=1122189 RepID=A0A1M6NRS2_MALRU|nr:TetR/AcrR family transcriptional regulator [Malonomonas rubra]SHJ98350.1 transcriptional regulator, TetR family [Malonomonas rubra DSM 5091]